MNAVLVCSACYDELELQNGTTDLNEGEKARSVAMVNGARCPVCARAFQRTLTKDSIHADLVDGKMLLDKLAARTRMLLTALNLERAR